MKYGKYGKKEANMLLIFSSGRSGTNLILEAFTGTDQFSPSSMPEDKLFFKRGVKYGHKYLTKCDTNYCESYKLFKAVMTYNEHLKVIWSVRHPYDWCMSKIYRGSVGREEKGIPLADDATYHGCVSDMYHMFSIYVMAITEFYNRVLVVKMEDMILETEKTLKGICDKFDLGFEESMLHPETRMRHEGKKERYKTLDKSQIDLYKQLTEVYDGFFADRVKYMKHLFRYMQPLCMEFDYKR